MSNIQPDYYRRYGAYEPIKVVRAWGLGYELGTVLKYISRAGKKDSTKEIEDLEKAAQFLQFKIEELRRLDLEKVKDRLISNG
jgi:hypothetical protein